MKRTYLISIAMALVLLLGPHLGLLSQSDNTLFWLRSVPQSTKANPAMLPNAKFYLGFPAVSSIYLGARNTGFAFGDFYRKDNMGDYYWDSDNMLSKLSDRNYFTGDLSLEVLSLGFNVGKGFFSLGISENINGSFTYPRDLMLLFNKGVDHFESNEIIPDFEGSEFGILHFREYGVGYSHPVNEKLSVGIKLKAVQGLGKVNFKANQLLVTEGVKSDYLLDADLEFNVALPFKIGPFESLGSNFEDDFDPKDYLIGFRNFGGAIDLGLVYKPLEILTIGLSATNLGYINWSSGVESFRMTGQTDFEGFEMDDIFGNQEGDDRNAFEKIRDALSEAFDVTSTDKTVKQNLPARFYASVGLHLGKIQTIGLVSRSEIIDGNLRPSFTFSYNLMPINALGLVASYSIVDNAPNHFGAGFNLNLGPIQVYAVSDNIMGASDPLSIQSVNARLGLNMVFGNRRKKKVVGPARDQDFFIPKQE